MGVLIGLAGGIGAGKSTVAALLADRGAVVIDADAIAHEVYNPGTEGHKALVDRFGADILGDDGWVDRRRLGEIVFDDRVALEDLNAIVHPAVRSEVVRRVLDAMNEDPGAVVVVEAALMTEIGWAGGEGTLWTVIAEPETVIDRLVNIRGMDPEDVELRMAAQAGNDERRRSASRVIENDGSLTELEAKVDAAWRELEPSESS